MGAPIVHFEVNSRDLKRAKEFYGNLFGWTIQDTPGMDYGMVDTGVKNAIGGGIGQVTADKPAFATFYAGVDDPQASLEKAVSMGGTVLVPVTEVPNVVTFALIADPDGCVIGLVKNQPMPPPPKAKAKKAVPKKKKAKAARKVAKKKKAKK